MITTIKLNDKIDSKTLEIICSDLKKIMKIPISQEAAEKEQKFDPISEKEITIGYRKEVGLVYHVMLLGKYKGCYSEQYFESGKF